MRMRSRFAVVLNWAGNFMIVLVSKVQVLLAMRLCPLSNNQTPLDLIKPSRILLIQLYDTVGDVMFTSPLIRELAQGFPECKLTVAVSAHGVTGLLDKNPHIADTIAVDVRCHKWLRPFLLPWRHWLLARKKLRPRGFDVAIIPRSSVDYCYATFLAYFSGTPCRVGYTEKMKRRKGILNCNWDQLLTVLLPPLSANANEVLLNLNVLSVFGKSAKSDHTEIWTSSEDRQFASAALESSRRKRVCISPTSGHSELKQWGIERFTELAGELVRHGFDVILVGSPRDKPLEIGRAHV